MAISVIGWDTGTNLANRSPTVTFDGTTYPDPTENDLLVMWVRTSTVVNVTDSTNSAWFNPLGTDTVVSVTGSSCACFCKLVTAAEEAAVTRTYTATNWFDTNKAWRSAVCVFRGADPALPIDAFGTVANTSSSTTHNLAAVTGTDITYSNGLVVSGTTGTASSGTYTTPGGWTAMQTGTSYGTYYRTTLATANTNVTATNITDSFSTPNAGATFVINPYVAPPPPSGSSFFSMF